MGLVVGEHLGIGAGVGAALILGGCLFSNMGSFDWFQRKDGSELAIAASGTANVANAKSRIRKRA